MSGYLQRMAASVTRPTRAVHAVVPGLFANEPGREMGVDGGEVETLVETQGTSQRAAEVTPVESVERRSVEDREDEPVRVLREAVVEREERSVVSPREPLVAGWKQAEMAEPKVERVEVPVRIEARREGEVRGGESDVKTTEMRADAETRLLVPAVRRVEDAGEGDAARLVKMEGPAEMRAVDVRREVAAQQQAKRDEARVVSAARGGEDIQIHIGRIEVIAGPQTVQRAAPAKAQRGETLEAYLKRHARRSR